VLAEQHVDIEMRGFALKGDLVIPPNAQGVVLFAHGSGSSRHSARNRFVARELQQAGFATFLMDLLTGDEEVVDRRTADLRFDIALLASRLAGATEWLGERRETTHWPIGYFGASTGAAAALVAAAQQPGRVTAVVSRGGRPDLAVAALPKVQAPTLLIVGGDDRVVIGLNEAALERLATPEKQLVIVPGAGHLFEEPGALEQVARHATDWFRSHLQARANYS
jgi:putative phosphoribosyl transferase